MCIRDRYEGLYIFDIIELTDKLNYVNGTVCKLLRKEESVTAMTVVLLLSLIHI